MPISKHDREAPPQRHRAVKRRARSNASSASASGKERVHMPVLPQLRALQQELQDAPVGGSGPRRVHPYRPVEDAVEGSSSELVPSLATQAPCTSGIDESLDATPIPRSYLIKTNTGNLHFQFVASFPCSPLRVKELHLENQFLCVIVGSPIT